MASSLAWRAEIAVSFESESFNVFLSLCAAFQTSELAGEGRGGQTPA